MTQARVAVLKIISGDLTVTDAAKAYGYSRRHLHRLLARYRESGLEAVDPRTRRPHTNPRRTSEELRTVIVNLRRELTAQGHDAGPVTIAWHLAELGLHAPSTSTIRRILHEASLVTAEPRKRPRSSYIRFEAAQPNETWQSDFTHTRLANGTDVEVLTWLDDHSRYLLSCTAHCPVTGDSVVMTFLAAIEEHGCPASTLTDNGRVYTARFGGGRNAFEYLLPVLGVTQKNGKPWHPQTQGKVERFQQTLKRWLAKQPTPTSLEDLQGLLDRFRGYYNTKRPHRSLNRTTPALAYAATEKALPTTSRMPHHYRIRYDRVDKAGRITLRRAGRLHHLHVGAAHRGSRVLAIIDDNTVTVTALETGEILATNTIEPNRNYWRNTRKPPGRWPGGSQ